jgi:hypothetical protein
MSDDPLILAAAAAAAGSEPECEFSLGCGLCIDEITKRAEEESQASSALRPPGGRALDRALTQLAGKSKPQRKSSLWNFFKK